MKWSQIKIFNPGVIMQEVEIVESKYDNLLNKVITSDKNDDKAKREFLAFREEIEMRLIDIDEFYQLNRDDKRSTAFIKIRNKLAEILEKNIKMDDNEAVVKKSYTPIQQIEKTPTKIETKFKTKLFTTPSKLSRSNASLRQSSIRQSTTSRLMGT